MTKRINVVLPVETMRVLNKIAPRGDRSRIISDAVMYYVSNKAKANLGERLRQGSLANSSRDLQLAEEWFPLDEEAWQPKRAKRNKK